MSRYRDRKLAKTYTFVGSDAFVDATARGQIRTAFEPGSGVVSNWDVMESVLDYIFLKLGVEGASGGVGRPIVMTEPVANLGYSRKSGFFLKCWVFRYFKMRDAENVCLSSSNDGDLV